MVSDRIVLAHEHVTKTRDIIARQHDLIAQIRAQGGPCGQEESLLSTFKARW